MINRIFIQDLHQQPSKQETSSLLIVRQCYNLVRTLKNLYLLNQKNPKKTSTNHIMVFFTQTYSGQGSTSFSPVTSTNVGFGPQNFLTFSFNPFTTLVHNIKFVPSASPKLLNLNHDHPQRKQFFWSNPYKIQVMITFLRELLVTKLWSHDHI